jgi:hypothetical protein
VQNSQSVLQEKYDGRLEDISKKIAE